ncbi:aminotransferase class III-fold pyridoxal phosphate-dependent enzyme [Granulicella sp. dw_53]|uniref:aminotransferase class III-fold pyridoxal phosphate-dependent enzyme n=1 Tax=Granulicella sp. dw_53 TaxID=2719792 RepID=UPI001BD67410
MVPTIPAIQTAIGLENQWLPFTPNRDFKDDPRFFDRAKGVYFYGMEGQEILDGSSGLFTTPAGHARQEIADAVYEQILRLDYTSSFLRSHPGSSAVCQKLVELLPHGLNRIFMVNSGSESVDTALKIALQYHRVRKQATRTLFVSRERAYHGANLTGVALSGIPSNRRDFGSPILPVVHMRHTWLDSNRFQPGQGEHGAELADDLLRLIHLHGSENIAACIVEPIAGSTGALVPPLGYLERLRDICTEHEVLLIFDEVICGFGRTGLAFASQSFGVTPDIITMAKAITNGVIPMGAVAVREDIYETIVEADPKRTVELFHGYTGSAHPVSCAASLATLKIYEEESLFERAKELSPHFLNRLFSLAKVPGITDIRGYGMIGGIDIDPATVGMDGYTFQKRLYDGGLHIKTTGNTLIVTPPFICTVDEIDRIIDIIETTLQKGR